MKISYRWLREYIKSDKTVEDIADYLTDLGLEVEGIEKIQSSNDSLVDVVVGEVTKCIKHPNADRLNVCIVYDGEEDYQVVCGAKNVAKDQTIAYAKVGSVLPGDFRLEKIKLRSNKKIRRNKRP